MRKFFIVLLLLVLSLTSGCLTPLPSVSTESSFQSSTSSSEPTNPSLTLPPVETSEQGSTAPSSSSSFSPSPSSSVVLPPQEISSGKAGKNRVSLTFDAGAGRGHIDEILEILLHQKVPAAFFITGAWAEQNPEDVKRIAELGFRIGNHTQNHLHLTELSDEEVIFELQTVESKILELTGESTKPFFRPPYGDRDQRILEIAASEGYWSIYWTLDSLDWQEDHDPDWVKNRILSNLQDGMIVLCHVASPYTYQILEDVIYSIRERGFDFVPLAEFTE